MLAALVSAFVLGGLFSLLVAASAWLYTTAVVKREKASYMPPFNPPRLPQGLSDVTSGGSETKESCNWFNLVTSFLFQELRDTAEVKSLILMKVHTEFNELMFTKKEGRMLEQLTVRDYDLGTSLPLFSNIAVLKKKMSKEGPHSQLEELCLGVDVEYSGGFRIGIDADLIFNRVAYVAVHVQKVKGRGQLQFTTTPHPHWSFSFFEDPEVVLLVNSTFEGRNFPQLSSFMEAQLRRWVRQKHCLPARKTRYKPFFSRPQPTSQLDELYVHNQKLTVGRLYVEVVKASQLFHSPPAVAIFCTLTTSSLPWQPLLGLWRSRWAEHEFRFQFSDLLLGIRYRLVIWEEKEERSEFIVIFEVINDSLAASSGVQVGDIIARVNNVKVHSVAQVQKTINKTKHGSVLLTVKRPPKYIVSRMLQSGSTHRATPTSQRTASGVSSDVEGEEGEVGEDGDSISLRGVMGERALPATSASQRPTTHPLDSRAAPLPGDTRNVDEEVVKQTEEVGACRGPRWARKTFRFNVGPQHRYLNLCVYERLAGEERGELLIGHVTVPLMDVALECLVSSSGRHQQRYVLMAPELSRATSSRAAVQASEGKKEKRGRGRGKVERKHEAGKKYVGSVLLRFKYSTLQHLATSRVHEEEEEVGEEGEEERDDGEEACDSPVEEVEEEGTEMQHHFQAREMLGSQKCNICTKRIWALKGRVQVCTKCGVQCHKKCLPLAYRNLHCKHATLHLCESRGFQIYDDLRDDGEHRGLQQQTSEEEGFVEVPNASDDFIRVGGEEDMWRDEKEEGEEAKEKQGNEWGTEEDEEVGVPKVSLKTVAEPDEEEKKSSSSDELSSGPESGDEREQVLAELLACRMLSHLPEPERPAAIRNKVAELEGEVARAEELVAGLQAELSGGHGNQESLRKQLRQHKEKLEPLTLMKEQYTLALHQMGSTEEP